MPISFSLRGLGGRKGSSPSPFDAINGPRLAGRQGSHPLHDVRAEELLRPSSGAVSGEITIDGRAMVGEGITGTIRLRAVERVSGRKASLRLVGLRLDEVQRSEDDDDGPSDSWVETRGKLFIEDAFLEPAIPATMEPGQVFEAPFAVPAPRLGPPTAHLGESIVAWALEVRWDVAMGSDQFVAMYLPLAQHPDLLRAGVGRQGGASMMAGIPVEDGMIGILSPLPVPAGTELVVAARWPSAPGGPKARIELHRKTNAPNGTRGIIVSAEVDPAALKGGVEARLAVPAGLAPSFDGAGLEITYILRVLVDRRFRTDAAIERPLAVV